MVASDPISPTVFFYPLSVRIARRFYCWSFLVFPPVTSTHARQAGFTSHFRDSNPQIQPNTNHRLPSTPNPTCSFGIRQFKSVGGLNTPPPTHNPTHQNSNKTDSTGARIPEKQTPIKAISACWHFSRFYFALPSAQTGNQNVCDLVPIVGRDLDLRNA